MAGNEAEDEAKGLAEHKADDRAADRTNPPILAAETRPPKTGEAARSALRDAALLAQFAAGDPDAARLLTERHADRLYAVALRMLRDAAEAEDVVQESFLRMWRAAPDWRAESARLSTWLYRVALNLCYDRLRRKRGEPLEAAPEPVDPDPSALERIEAKDGADSLRGALDTLPDRQRAALILRHYEERSNPEIAETLEISVEAVESLLARGRRALKAKLAPHRGVTWDL